MPTRHLFKTLAATLVAGATLFSAKTSLAVTDSFESPTLLNGTPIASGSDVAGYVGPLGTWKDTNSAMATSATNQPQVYNSSDAYSGSWYLHQLDTSGNASAKGAADTNSYVTGATLTFNTTAAAITANNSIFSFALRDDASYNNNQITVFGTSGGSTYHLFQVGLQNTSVTTPAAKFSATSYSGTGGSGTAIAITPTINANYTPIAGDWYLFTLVYTANGSTGTYALKITDGSSTIYTGTVNGNTSLTVNPNYSSLVTATAGAAVGYADVDAISLVPEPASVSLLCIGGAGIMLKRRRRQGNAAIV